MSILLLLGISAGYTGEKFYTADSPESPAICGVLYSHHLLCEEYFFLCFKLANTLQENDTQTVRFTLLSGTHLDAQSHVLLSLLCTPTFMTFPLPLGPALPHYLPRHN